MKTITYELARIHGDPSLTAEHATALIAAGIVSGGVVSIPADSVSSIQAKYKPGVQVAALNPPAKFSRLEIHSPARPDSWPKWAKAVRLLAKAEDRGIGDTVARTIGPVGGDAFKAWYLKTFEQTCGCQGRQEFLNKQFPYTKKEQ